jgi:type I restriction enzyme, R subunit
LRHRRITAVAAMDVLAALAKEKEEALAAARESGLSTRAFAVYWSLKDDPALREASISALTLAQHADAMLSRYPNAGVNEDEHRRLRAGLYRPLLSLDAGERTRIVYAVLTRLQASVSHD